MTLATRPPVNPCARQRGHAEPGAMSDDFWRAVLDPSAPLPHAWPVGALGVFLLFCVPIGGGIPAGVLMTRNAGVPPPAIAVLYFFSDIVLAFTFEPILRIVTWLGRWLPPLARVGSWIRSLAHRAGGAQTGARGPLGLILVAFGVDPMTGRASTPCPPSRGCSWLDDPSEVRCSSMKCLNETVFKALQAVAVELLDIRLMRRTLC